MRREEPRSPGPGVYRVLGRLRARIDETIAERGLVYPWWIPALSLIGQAVAVLGALQSRDALWPPAPVAVAFPLVLAPGTLMLLGRRIPHWVEDGAALLAAAWLFGVPLATPGSFDWTPALLAIVTAAVVARSGLKPGLLVAGLSAAMIAAMAAGPGLALTPVQLIDIVLGLVVGSMLLYQMRALKAERIAREGERARATLAERERIAREIHDLVAHSLSVTLLQITGARHSLSDLRPGPGEDALEHAEEVAEIDAALADAERVGRQAMADIRQTVSTLAEGPGPTEPLPGGTDVAALVEQMSRAGLRIDFEQDGDPGRLAQALGLGVYRIAQESLANIAKHAPGSTARVRLRVTGDTARLTVRNAIASRAPAPGPTGSGLVGMRARAEQLGASLSSGRDGADWVVDLQVPLRERNGQLVCPRKVWRWA